MGGVAKGQYSEAEINEDKPCEDRQYPKMQSRCRHTAQVGACAENAVGGDKGKERKHKTRICQVQPYRMRESKSTRYGQNCQPCVGHSVCKEQQFGQPVIAFEEQSIRDDPRRHH
jgi:hypothetical protein